MQGGVTIKHMAKIKINSLYPESQANKRTDEPWTGEMTLSAICPC